MKEVILTDIDVNKLTGKNGLVIFFYPKAGTSGCSLEVAAYNAKLKEFDKLGYNVVGVSGDTTKENDDFSCEYDLDFPLVSDEKHKYIDQYKVWGDKERDGVKSKGIIRSTFVVDNKGNEIIEMRNVEPTKHIDDLLTKLKAMNK